MKRKRDNVEFVPHVAPEANLPTFPFVTDADDHCETDLAAYQDIVPILYTLSRLLDKSPEDLRIYDPYYCNGKTVELFESLGFSNVYNKKEDFYNAIEQSSLPEFDVLITNPPYSSDHIPRLLDFLFKCNKPWIVLFPNYVYLKPEFYRNALGTDDLPALIDRNTCQTNKKKRGTCQFLPFYVIPPQERRRYKFTGIGGRKTSPFHSFWFIRMNPLWHNQVVIEQWRSGDHEACLATNLTQIPIYIQDANDRRIRADRDRKKSMKRREKRRT